MDILSWYKEVQIYSYTISASLFVFAAGMLFYRVKSVPTAIFFSGLFIYTYLIFRIDRIFALHQTDPAGLQIFIKFAMYRDLAFIVEVIGLLLYVFTLAKDKKAGTL